MADSLGLAVGLDDLPVAAFIARRGVLVVGNLRASAFVDTLLAPDGRWWGVDDSFRACPWHTDVPWTGYVEGIVAERTWHFHVTTTPRPDGASLTLCWLASPAEVARQLVARAVDALPDMFTLTTSDLDAPGPMFVVVNRTFERITGHDRATAIGLGPKILQGPQTDRGELARLRRCLEAGQLFRGGTVNYRRNGETFFNEWSIGPVSSPSGATHYVSIMRDATDARLHVDQLKAAASAWVRVIDVLDEMVVFVDLERRILRCNEAFRRLLERTFRDLVGRDVIELLFPGRSTDEVDRMLHSGGPPVRIAPHGGWFRITVHPVHDGPVLAGRVLVLDDVTDRLRAEERAQRLVTATEQAQDGIALLDAHGRLEYLNAAYARLLKVDRDAGLGADARGLLGASDQAAGFDSALARARHDGISITQREARWGDDWPRREELEIRRLADPQRGGFTGFAVIARDVTERERLSRLSEAASAMENMGHWLAGLRHELGNPVNSVKMALTVLGSNLASLQRDEIARYVERALSELARVEYLLRSLRTVSAIDRVEVTRLELSPFFARVTTFVAPDLRERGIELTVDCPAAMTARADPHALLQVVVNLVTNAADAIGDRPGSIAITARRRDDVVVIAVRDDGAGMSAARLARMFTPFDTTKAGGTGLGLIIVRKLMTAMNGTVTIDSVENVGTTATLALDGR